MLAVSGCGSYIFIALQVLNVHAYGFEDCELSTKFTAKTRGDIEKTRIYVGH